MFGFDSTGHLSQLLYPSTMLLSFKTFETETFSTEVRLLLPRADHLLCPAFILFCVYSVVIGRAVVSFRLRLQSFTVYLRVR